MAKPAKIGRSRSSGRRPLYPGWGSGNLPFVGNFLVRSVTESGRTELEIGDKIILPEACLSDISRLRLPFPLIFEIRSLKRSSKVSLSRSLSKGLSQLDESVVTEYRKRIRAVYSAKNPGKLSDVEYLLQKYHRDLHTLYANVCQKYSVPVRDPMDRYQEKCAASLSKSSKSKDSQSKKKIASKSVVFRQFCGVQEFSAPKRTAYLPLWMMDNLQLKSGDPIEIESQFDLAKGTFALLEPCDAQFLETVSSVGIREILENSLRCYSTLSIDERIIVEFDGRRWDLIVRDLKPSFVVSILGSTDLSVDFKVNEDSIQASKPTVKKDPGKSDWFPDWCEVEKKDSSSGIDDQFIEENECKEDDIPEPIVPPVSSDVSLLDVTDSTDVVSILKQLDIPLEYELQESLRCSLESKPRHDGSMMEEDVSDLVDPFSSMDLKSAAQETSESMSKLDSSSINDGNVPDFPEPGPDEFLCEHCGKIVHKMSEMMHVMQCVKKFVKCDQCQIMVNRDSYERHMKEYHTQVQCSLCEETFNGSKALEMHEKEECSLRLVKCQYCDRMDIVAQDIHEHSMKCKREMVDCDKCGESFMRMFRSKHVCKQLCVLGCGKRVSSLDMKRHCLSDECSKRVAQCPYCKMIRNVCQPDWTDHLEYCGSRSEKCELCSKWVKLCNMEKHLSSNCKEFANTTEKKSRKQSSKEKKESSEKVTCMSDESLIKEEESSQPQTSTLSAFAQSAQGLRSSSLAAFTGESTGSSSLDPTRVQSVRQNVVCPHCQFDYYCRDTVEFQTHICTNHPEKIDDPLTKSVLKSMYKSEVSSLAQVYAYPRPIRAAKPKSNKSKPTKDETPECIGGDSGKKMKPGKKSASECKSWACLTCTFENELGSSNCQLCGAGKS